MRLSLLPPLFFLCTALHAQTLQRGNGPEPSTLDAHRCPEVACANVLRDLYEGLVDDSYGDIRAGMAESWEVSRDGLHWTFLLRKNLRWSNGAALTANDIVASFRRAFLPSTAAPFAGHFAALKNANAVQQGQVAPEALGVSAPDAHTVIFELTRPTDLPPLLALPIAYPVYLPAVTAHGAQHTRPGNLLSNGAYRLHAWRPQANITVARNAFFHAAAPIKTVIYHVTEDASSELQRYQAGDLHLTETVPPQPLQGLRERFGAQLRISPYLGSFFFGLNLDHALLRENKPLREALSLALDRNILTRHVTGLGELPAYGLVPTGIAGYTPASLSAKKQSQAQRESIARKLYIQAGYSKEKPLEIELRYNTSTPHRRLALAAAAMWREVLGAHVVLRNEEWKVFVQNRKQRLITQIFRGGWIADVSDARNFLDNFRSESLANWSGFSDERYDQLLLAADASIIRSERNNLLHEAESYLLDQHALIPLYFYTSKHLVRPEVRGFIAHPLDHHPSRLLRFSAPSP